MKKLISTVLVLCILLSIGICTAGAYTLPEGYAVSANEGDSFSSVDGNVYGYVGDADENGKVNVRDATTIQKSLAKIVTLSENAKTLSDVDFSGAVNVRDATAIQKWVANIVVDAPIYHILYDDSYSKKIADYEAYKKIIDEQIASIKAEGPLYRGSDTQFAQEVSSLTSEISSLNRQIRSMSWDTSISAKAKCARLQAEVDELQSELDELYAAKSRTSSISALEFQLENYYEQLFG